MLADEIIDEVRESWGEWLEMSPNPDLMVIKALAHKVVQQSNHIEYLERRLKRVTAGCNYRN
jgi:hypothetical protein